MTNRGRLDPTMATRLIGAEGHPTQPAKLKTIDLFAGAGGMTVGLRDAGFTASLVSDLWEPAVETLRANFPSTPVLQADICRLTPRSLLEAACLTRAPDLIVGGPPCQGFSSAGSRRAGDERNTLVQNFAEMIAAVRPSAFVFENVEGFLTLNDGDFVVDLLDPLIEAGYRVRVKKVNVANYGVPQLRKRVIAIGALHGSPRFPEPTHHAYGAPGVHRIGRVSLPLTPSIGEALAGLPTASRTAPGVPSDHHARVTDTESARIRALRQGQTMRDLPVELQHPSFTRRANRRVADGTPTERRGGAPAGMRRLLESEPSKAITSAATREFIHPTEDRPLTLRECARLQTFPDTFAFSGSQSERATLIGNAVPPRFAAAIGHAVAAALATHHSPRVGRGQLLSFDVTAADAMSPALASVVDRIEQRYGLRSQLSLEVNAG